MLRKIRIISAIFFFIAINLLFLDFTGTVHSCFKWTANIQFITALLALNIGIIITLVFLTLIFGRVYCSIVCPLGIFQDIVSWVAGKRKKNRFSYSPAILWLRYGLLTVFIVAIILELSSVVVLFEPYGVYGRVASNLFVPIWRWGNNILAYFAERIDSYAFYNIDVWLESLTTLIVAVMTSIIIGILAWRNGRTYCNTICPVGSILGVLAKYSFFKPVIDPKKCNECNLCARSCKASCIDVKTYSIDYSRCVTCMNCIEECKRDAISYISRYIVKSVRNKPSFVSMLQNNRNNNSRRSFLSVATLFAFTSAIKSQQKIVEGGLAVIEEKKVVKRDTPVKPAGSLSVRNFSQHCTACGLCISVCPNQVLRPSGNLTTLMQPEMSFQLGYCRPECTKCSEICPTGAINRVTKAEKSATQIGYAVWIRNNCVVITDDVDCDNCVRHCPTGAIQMVSSNPDNPNARKIPVVDIERCIGCGACEYLCPSRPFSAIYVEGVEKQRII